jgi:hypothetical protein
MLESRYSDVTVDVVWKPHSKGDGYYESIFGPKRQMSRVGWHYAGRRKKDALRKVFFTV